MITGISEHAVILQKNYQTIVQNIYATTTITDQLVSSQVLNLDEMQEVCLPGLTHAESNRRFIAKPVYKLPKAFNCFLQSLRKDNCYDKIVEDIDKTAVTSDDIHMLRIGNLYTKFLAY